MAYNIYTNTFDYQPQPKKRAEQLQKQKAEARAHVQEEMLSSSGNQAENEVNSTPN